PHAAADRREFRVGEDGAPGRGALHGARAARRPRAELPRERRTPGQAAPDHDRRAARQRRAARGARGMRAVKGTTRPAALVMALLAAPALAACGAGAHVLRV